VPTRQQGVCQKVLMPNKAEKKGRAKTAGGAIRLVNSQKKMCLSQRNL